MRTELQSGCFLRAVCLLLVTFDPGAAKRCPTCDPGYFVIKNCSGNEGIQCSRCTDCSASHKETLVNCSTFADSLCGNKSPPTTAQPAGGDHTAVPQDVTTNPRPLEITSDKSAAEVWIPITVTVSSLLLVLLAVSLAMLSRWKHQPKKPDGPDQV
ncbi:hypothetical protein PFLUV_G00171580 [Perca fluviatilis]|uniref:TNFR-Cys domain-containing protein n=1 Tax=Perca fluviatilis TaxID=8168 RepID=A0A6A5EZL7_PERFL|nr:hypothetical protein PFLUV_G00171580 [Perca fluviatilis]